MRAVVGLKTKVNRTQNAGFSLLEIKYKLGE